MCVMARLNKKESTFLFLFFEIKTNSNNRIRFNEEVNAKKEKDRYTNSEYF